MTTTDHAASRADELYGLLLRHIDVCQACNAMEDCVQGTRLRRALRRARKGTPRS
ncbi:hypothetical protein [Streptomyces flavofungini]|uniref:Uncharacterized protein n=1 Tax=Streptomyces flavofungini TaxID=68200 RepID=A0ABS0XJ17_9ACTN|nr:hypothetical protein [Streptomyces flavofungini]MBJ3813185.1 hypothetical protein [Streptomyces flavofungini]GHC90298.1 hypothetical protein GCM10010349_78540 [Streptomyces flavofungini]